MTVAELIERLSRERPSAQVIVQADNDGYATEVRGGGFTNGLKHKAVPVVIIADDWSAGGES